MYSSKVIYNLKSEWIDLFRWIYLLASSPTLLAGVNSKWGAFNKTQLNAESCLNAVVSQENYACSVICTLLYTFPTFIDPPFVFRMEWHPASIFFYYHPQIPAVIEGVTSQDSRSKVTLMLCSQKTFFFFTSIPACFCFALGFPFLAACLLASFRCPHLHSALPGVPLRHRCFERAPRRTYFCALVRLGNLVN